MKNRISKIIINMLVISTITPDFVFARARKRTAMFSKARMEYKRKFASNSVVKNNKSAVERNVKISTINKQNVTNNVVNISNARKEYKIADDRIAKLKLLVADVNKAKENVVAMCGGISTNLSKIKALAITSTISSAVGTGLGAGALATGIMKTKQEEKEQEEKDRLLQAELDKRARESIERQKRIKEEQEKERKRIIAEKQQEMAAKKKAEEEKQQLIEEQNVQKENEVKKNIEDKQQQIEEKKDTEVKQITEQNQVLKGQEQTEQKNETEVKENTEQNQIAKGEQTTDEKTKQDNIEVKKEDKKEEQEKKKTLEAKKITENISPEVMRKEREKLQRQEQFARNKKFDDMMDTIDAKERELRKTGEFTPRREELFGYLREGLENEKRFIEESGSNRLREEQKNYYNDVDDDDDDNFTEAILQLDEDIAEKQRTEERDLKKVIERYNDLLGFELITPLLAPEKLGHIRTGLLGGASLTSAVSMGTSAGATMNSGKLYEKMEGCNNAIAELKKVNGILVAEVLGIEADLKANDVTENPDYIKNAEQVNKTAKNITKSCKRYETKDIKLIKNLMTASSVISGIGTATALTGAITSGIANSQNTAGTKNGKKLDLTANIMAGITTGTSFTTTGLSATAAAKLGQKLMEQATTCEAALN